jgi:hypothetical protein
MAKRLDRQLMLALLVSAAVLVPRGILIARLHGPTVDENYHLYRGLLLLRQDRANLRAIRWNDPPLGEAITAIPAWLNRVHLSDPMYAFAWNRQVPPPEDCYVVPTSIRIETAIWKSLLFLPAIGVIFYWVRSVYSAASAWLALATVLIDPTLAAHLPLPTLDGLATGGIVIAAYAVWRFLREPTSRWQLLAAAAVAVALLLKNTAAMLSIATVIMAALAWIGPRRTAPKLWPNLRKLIVAAALVPLFIWILLLGDISVPQDFMNRPLFAKGALLSHGIPCGIYVESVLEGLTHVGVGHESYLLGQTSQMGWWYYFPVVATYKIPIGIAVVIVLGLASLAWIRPRFEELPLAICAVLWTGLALAQRVDIGFRHFLPALMFWLMLASRIGCSRGWFWLTLAWLALAGATVDTIRCAPDFLSYINFPRKFAYLDISDSNVDWGQATDELRQWLAKQPDDGRPIYLAYFGPRDIDLFEQIGPRLSEYMAIRDKYWISRNPTEDTGPSRVPNHGILILSPIWVSGQYDPNHVFAGFQDIEPEEVIGHSLLVYDLDKLNATQRK